VPPLDWLLPALLYEERIVVFDLDRPPVWLKRRAESLKALQRAGGTDLVSSHHMQSDDVERRALDLLDNRIYGLALEHTGHDTIIGRWSDCVRTRRDVDRSVDEHGSRRRTGRPRPWRDGPFDPMLEGRLAIEKVGYQISGWLKHRGGAAESAGALVLPRQISDVVLATLGDEVGRRNGWKPAGRSATSTTTRPTDPLLVPAFELLSLPVPAPGSSVADVLAIRSQLTDELGQVRALLHQSLQAASAEPADLSLDVSTERLRSDFAPLLDDIGRAMELRKLRSVRTRLKLTIGQPGRQLATLLSGMGIATVAGAETLDAAGIVGAVSSCVNPRELAIGTGVTLATAVVQSALASVRYARAEDELGSSPFWALYEQPGLTTMS